MCFVPMMQDTSVVANFTVKPSDSGGTGGGSSESPVTPGPTSSSASPTPTPPPTKVTKKPLRCKKGFREVKKKGKALCVRTKAKPKKGRRG